MNYIVLGLPSTGKTTICKTVEQKLNLTYVNDYQILKINNITFSNNSDILNKDYSKYIFNYLKGKDNLIVDLQYTVKPNQIKQMNAVVYYLGFANIEPIVLMSFLNQKDNLITLDVAKLFVQKSKEMKELCKIENVTYYEIGKNRNEIINNIISQIIDIKKSC